MSKYGRVIEDIREIKHTDLYRLFCDYFENPLLTKTSEQGVSSVYAVKANSGLMLDNKYLIVVVNGDKSDVGVKRKLSDLQWASLQTRTVRDKLNVGVFSYSAKRTSPFTDKITLVSKNESSSTYTHENLKELNITLLNSEKMQFEYPQQGTLTAALETYRTVLVLN